MNEHYDAIIKKLEAMRNMSPPESICAAFALAYLEKLKTPNATAICNMARIMEGSFEP